MNKRTEKALRNHAVSDQIKNDTAGSESALSDLLCPFDDLESVLALSPKDWSIDKNDAWIYGIVLGWDDDSLKELKNTFRWDADTVDRLKALHEAFVKLKV